MVRWSAEEFWDAMESFAMLWYGLAVADAVAGLVVLFLLLTTQFDTSDPSVIVSVLDLAVVVITLIPLGYVLYRVRERRLEEY